MKRASLLLPIAIGAVAAAGVAGYYVYATSRASVQIAPNRVVRAEGDFEVRDYPVLKTAETSLRGENDAFMRLFRFIAGGNARQEKIAMTAPVLIEGGHTMSFVLPEALAARGVPPPTGEGVTLGERPAMRVIAVRYSGNAKAADECRQRERLQAWAEAQGIATVGEPIDAFYDSPFVPGFLRRNEVLLRVAE